MFVGYGFCDVLGDGSYLVVFVFLYEPYVKVLVHIPGFDYSGGGGAEEEDHFFTFVGGGGSGFWILEVL